MLSFFEHLGDFFLHLDRHLGEAIVSYGPWIYAILFLIVFCETGLVVTPFLPGDSLLFAAGLFSHSDRGGLNIYLVFTIFISAALLGDNVNYWIGRLLGKRILKRDGRLIKKKHIELTHGFFERYGGRTIVIARFVPIVRTFTPFVAGMGSMTYPRFLGYSVIGALVWVGVCCGAGYFFGGLKPVRENFGIAVLAMVGVSILPMVYEWIQHCCKKKRMQPVQEDLVPVSSNSAEEA